MSDQLALLARLLCSLAIVVAIAGCDDGNWWLCDGGLCDAVDCGVGCVEDAAPDGSTEPDSVEPVLCGDGFCTAPEESASSCPDDCAGCSLLADVTKLIGTDELFYGYSVLGTSSEAPGCGGFASAKEVSVGLTPDFSGDLVLSTQHPSTMIDTVLEVREDRCDGVALGCNDVATAGAPGSRLTISVETGRRYVALVETSDDAQGVFALGLHRPGVCEGLGTMQDITAQLLTGQRFEADTSTSTASVSGACSAGDSAEVRYTFTAPRTGPMIATTVHPNTAFDTVIHVREGAVDGRSNCDSPEMEVGCAAGGAPGGLGTVVRFDVQARFGYDLFIDGADGQGLATLTIGYAETSPAEASLQGCDHEAIRDQFAFFVQSGQPVFVAVDTVDADTAADMRLRLRLPDGSELHEADDDVDCTFDPPSWSCPQYAFTAGSTGLYSVEVYVGSSEACRDRSLANYQLTVDVADVPSELILIRDQ